MFVVSRTNPPFNISIPGRQTGDHFFISFKELLSISTVLNNITKHFIQLILLVFNIMFTKWGDATWTRDAAKIISFPL